MKIKILTNLFYCCIFFSFFLCGCKGKSVKVVLHDNIEKFANFPLEDSVFFKNVYELKGVMPAQIKIIDSTLIIFNFARNRKGHSLYNFYLKENKLSNGYLEYGRGPNEVIGPFGFMINDNKLWMYDITLKKLMSTDLDNALNGNSVKFNSFPVKTPHYQISMVDSLTYLTVGDPLSLSKIQMTGLISQKKIKEYGKFTLLDDAPIDAVKDGYQSHIHANPSGKKVVLPYRYEDIIEIFDLKLGTSIAVQGPDQIVLDFKPTKIREGQSVYMVEKDTRRTYGKPTVTDKYIYLPYSGHRRGNRSEEERFKWNYENVVHVFDWNGNPVRKLVLDCYISSISVTSDDKTMYSFNPETGYLIKADISSILN